MDDDLIYKTYKLNMKSSNPDGTFDGVASTSALDSDGEIVDKGAFTRTLNNSKGIFPILWQHIREAPVGWNKSAEEDDRGLAIHAQLLMNSEQGRYAHDFISTGLDTGGKPGLSIGFQVPKGGEYIKDGVRHFKEVILREVSIVTFPANSEAVVIGSKGAIPYGNLPLASEDMSWDGDSARSALTKWSGGPDKDKMNWGKFRKGFLWFDPSNPDELGSYKLPFATILNGKLMAVPKGIMAAAGGHGVNSADIPEDDKAKVRNVITQYYKKMKKDSPFKKEGEGGSVTKDLEFKTQDFVQEMARNQAMDEHYDLKWKADKALRDVIDNICSDKECTNAEKKPLIHKALDGHSDVMKSWWSAFLDITQPEDEDPGDEMDDEEMSALLETLSKGEALTLTAKEGRALSARTKLALKKCMGNIHESITYSKMSADCKKKALGQLGDLATGRYFNDVNAPHPVGGGASTTPPKPTTGNPVGGGGKLEQETRERLDKLEREQQERTQELKAQQDRKAEELLDEIANSIKKIA
jgi:HK97 family phage prohead protease